MVDDQVDSFFVRDLDSIISTRERAALEQFLEQSDKAGNNLQSGRLL